MTAAVPPRQWLRRMLWLAGLAVLTALLATVATFNANNVEPNINFTMPRGVLLQVRDADKAGWLTLVIADSGKKWFVIPADAVLSNGVTVQTVESTARSLNLDQTSAALEDVLKVEFDEVWQVDRLGLSAFVEAAGGVEVTPKTTVVLSPLSAPDLSVLGAVTVRLSGVYAALYAVDPSIEKPIQRYRRFDEVWRELMAHLDAATLPEVLPAIGSASRSSMTQLRLVAFIDQLQQIRSLAKPQVVVLPTIEAIYYGQPHRYLLSEARETLIAAGIRERITA